MHAHLNVAVKAARRAGNIILRHFEQLDSADIEEKGHNDLVTIVDKNAEADIIETILRAYPHHTILGEEGGYVGDENSDHKWIIDPLDGTFNFVHGIPQFAVSIGLAYRGVVEHGVIYNPVTQELYTASKGAGAQLNGRRIRVSKALSLQNTIIGAGLSEFSQETIDNCLACFKDVVLSGASIRRLGSATLNLAYIAAGKLDGFWALGLKEWDMAAGSLLVREAGGFIGDFEGESNYMKSGKMIAGNPKVFAQLLKILNQHNLSN